METFMGMRIVVNPLLDNFPRMQLTPKFAAMMPPDWVAETNAWMREFFGTENQVIMMGAGMMAMGPRSIAALRARGAL